MPLPASEALCVLVADDEMPARQRIIDLLRSHSRGVAIIEACDGLSAVQIIQDRRPDLVFLDVQMPELNGLEVIAEVGAERMPLTVFVTAYDQHAIRAFEANALDYLLKPFSDERFEATMARVSIRMDERSVRGVWTEYSSLDFRSASGGPAAGPPGGEIRRLNPLHTGGRYRLDRSCRGLCEPAHRRKGTVVPVRAERACRPARSRSFCPHPSFGYRQYREHPAPGADLPWRI
jgi:CheY-like chemotaxis protein